MTAEERFRLRIATSCGDSACIPKVANAGEVITSLPSARPHQVMHNGLKVYLDSHFGAFNVEVIRRLRGHHEPQEEFVFHEVLGAIPRNGVMLELGSCWAYYSMWFNRAVPDATNLMVEPIGSVMQCGVDNFHLNGLKGDFTQACVGRESAAHVRFQHWDGTCHDIPQVSVDDFLKMKGVEYLEILHADVQSSEYEMLLGAAGSLSAGRIGFLFVSTHSEALHARCLRLLRDADYTVIAEHSLWESFATDGLIVVGHRDRKFPQVRISKRRYVARIRSRLAELGSPTAG